MLKFKRFIIALVFSSCIIGFVFFAEKFGLATTVYKLVLVDSLTDGTSTSLNGIHSSTSGLPNNAFAFSMLSGTSIIQMWKYDSGATGSNQTTTHPFTVIPADFPSTGLWTEQSVSFSTGYVSGTSGVLTGVWDLSGASVSLNTPTDSSHAATKKYVDDNAVSGLSGDTEAGVPTGLWDFTGGTINFNATDMEAALEAVLDIEDIQSGTSRIFDKTGDATLMTNWDTAYGWGDHSTAGYISGTTDHSVLHAPGGDWDISGSYVSGQTDEGNWNMSGVSFSINTPTDNSHAVNKAYVDAQDHTDPTTLAELADSGTSKTVNSSPSGNSNYPVVSNGENYVAIDPGSARTALGLAIGSDVQAYDANILSGDTNAGSPTGTWDFTGGTIIFTATDMEAALETVLDIDQLQSGVSDIFDKTGDAALIATFATLEVNGSILGGVSPFRTYSGASIVGLELAGGVVDYVDTAYGGVTIPYRSGSTEVVNINVPLGSGLTVFTEQQAAGDRILDGSSWGSKIYCVPGTVGNMVTLRNVYISGVSDAFWQVVGKVGIWTVE